MLVDIRLILLTLRHTLQCVPNSHMCAHTHTHSHTHTHAHTEAHCLFYQIWASSSYCYNEKNVRRLHMLAIFSCLKKYLWNYTLQCFPNCSPRILPFGPEMIPFWKKKNWIIFKLQVLLVPFLLFFVSIWLI